MWNEQFLWLAGLGYRVIRYDARGHGRSSTVAGDYSHHGDLRALLTHLDVPCATLVGLSLGARTAIDTALAHPESVPALVLASPGVSGRPFADPTPPTTPHGRWPGRATRTAERSGSWSTSSACGWTDRTVNRPRSAARCASGCVRRRPPMSCGTRAGSARGHRGKPAQRTGRPPSACPPWFSTENSTAVTSRQTLGPSPKPFPMPGAGGSPRSPHGQPRERVTLQPRAPILPRVDDGLLEGVIPTPSQGILNIPVRVILLTENEPWIGGVDETRARSGGFRRRARGPRRR
ncbi:alpha/beta fold hydrolase [Streptomyces erythrochromogenes]|uniref:alpha/beta fold hydrolase n=1 Tax=Streptomyces erythrochromogenes TaxID=285574 RepID=UPI00341E5E85